jgi:ribosome-associated translation inhibitor RaiA
MFSRALFGRAAGGQLRQALRPTRRFLASEAPKPAGGPNPMLIGGALAVAGVGGYMMLGGKSEETVAKPAAAAPTAEATAPTAEATAPTAAATQTAAPDGVQPLDEPTEAELADLQELAGRLDKIESTIAKVAEVKQRLDRLEERLKGGPPEVDSAAAAALAQRLAAAEAALKARSGEAELEDPQVLAALEMLAAKLEKLERKSMGK